MRDGNAGINHNSKPAPWKGAQPIPPGKRSAARGWGSSKSRALEGRQKGGRVQEFCRPSGALVEWDERPRAAL
ncbi:MAG TPA: hypothetical protein VE398_01380, partial [Acidobacteriota bacterium]|nr:hypothetical protein [Acidobacteriota bacterium]